MGAYRNFPEVNRAKWCLPGWKSALKWWLMLIICGGKSIARDNLIPVLAYKAVQHFVKSKKTTNVSPATWSPNLAWFGGEDVSHGHAGVAHADSRALK